MLKEKMRCSQATSVDRASESLLVTPGLPGCEDLASAIEECQRQLETGMPGTHLCSDAFQGTLQKGKEYKGHPPLRHRPRPSKVRSLGFADQFASIEQMWAAELMIHLDANTSNFLKGICFLL